jgi:hypothetical protein
MALRSSLASMLGVDPGRHDATAPDGLAGFRAVHRRTTASICKAGVSWHGYRTSHIASGDHSDVPTIAKGCSRIAQPRLDTEMLKTLVIFCGLGLIISLVFVHYGLELGA